MTNTVKYDVLLKGKASREMIQRLNTYFNVIDGKSIVDEADFFHSQGQRIVAILTSEGASEAVIAQLPMLKIIACNGVGYDAIDVDCALKHGIMVTHTPEVLNQDVANTAIMMMLALSRRLMRDGNWIAQGRWLTAGAPPLTESIEGKRVGIYGLGRIGRVLARKLEAFNCQISYHSRRKLADVSYPYVETLAELARDVDYLVVIVPASDATYHTVDEKILAALGSKGALINIARGSVVDEQALVTAIENGTLGGAALDVFEHEPYVPTALFDLENVLLLPHVGSATRSTRKAMGNLAVDNIIDFIVNGKAHTPVPECAALAQDLRERL